jgi:FdhE protein
MTQDDWLNAHGYLRSLAQLCAQVDAVLVEIEPVRPEIPRWDDYRGDYEDGVPLLRSTDAAIDLEHASRVIGALLEKLASIASTGTWTQEARVLGEELHRDPAASRRVVDWLLGADDLAPSSAGLLRYLGWSALARHLRPLVVAFETWREEDRWQRSYCPTCGSPPAMAQLIGADPARVRLLSCGCCRTRWRYGRTRCPFCENDSQRLVVVAVEGEGGLRIDSCESCKGYLKTYAGQGEESLFLSDWSSLHLDVLAHDRGLKRLAGSLFELGALGG